MLFLITFKLKLYISFCLTETYNRNNLSHLPIFLFILLIFKWILFNAQVVNTFHLNNLQLNELSS